MKEFARKTGGGVGKLFSVDLIDAAGDEIRATAFTEVAEKLYGLLEVGHVYLISKGEVKVANKKFTTIPHSFEITFTNATVVSPVVEDSSTASIPVGHFSFVPIEKIASMDANELVDVLGVVTQTTDAQTFTQKSTGRDLTKKTLTLMDNTAYSIEVTLWGDLAKNTNPDVGNVVAIRAARVGTFNGKSLSTGGASQVTVSPDIAEAKKLFAQMDKDKNGCLDATEIKNLCCELDWDSTTVPAAIAAFDSDGDSKINCDEFIQYYKLKLEGNKEGLFEALFKKIDKDTSGFIDIKEMLHFGELIGEPMSQEEAEGQLKDMDTNFDGKVNFKELYSVFEDAEF